MIGDRWKDIAAGHAAGCRTILLRDRPYADEPIIEANAEVRRFSDAVCVIALNENRTPLLQVGEDDSA
jgi:beta-phosphoglucomutase-like phosphatase (HAD superfamily)